MNFKQEQKDFDVVFKKAKRNHNRQNKIEIENMIYKNGNEMWQKIDQIGAQDKYKVKIPLEVTLNGISIVNEILVLNKWKDDFSSLYKGIPTGMHSYDNSFVTQVKNEIYNQRSYDLSTVNSVLNTTISLAEVKEMTKHIKNNKAVSVDKIPNEVLKSKSCVKVLHAMYNICVKNALIPDTWRKAIISPIFKGKTLKIH